MTVDDGVAEEQVAWVFDLNKCNGCGACSTACNTLWSLTDEMERQWWATVTTKPGEGHPRGWETMGGGYDDRGELVLGRLPTDDEVHHQVELDWESVDRTAGRPAIRPRASPEWMVNWEEDQGSGVHPNSWHFYMPMICMHCSRPSCVEACPEDAIIKRREDGVVVIDEHACQGNRQCQRACPYKVIWFNDTRDRDRTGISQKCIGCIPRLEHGVPPACARSCPARAVHFGLLDDEDHSVYRLVHEWEVALPLHAEYNTQPNVFYVPPLSSPRLDADGRVTGDERIPRDYLRSIFGDRVDRAIETIRAERETVANGGESELIDLLVGWHWPDEFFGAYTTHPDEVVS